MDGTTSRHVLTCDAECTRCKGNGLFLLKITGDDDGDENELTTVQVLCTCVEASVARIAPVFKA